MKTKTKHILIVVLLIWLSPAISNALYQPIGIIKLLIQSQFATVFSSTYDIATPAGTDSPTFADDRMREIKAAVQERMAVDHKFSLTGTEVSATDTGEHTKITFNTTISDPTQVSGKAHAYMKSDELFYQDDTNTTVQITSAGALLGDSLKDDSVDEDAIELSNNAFMSAEDFGGGGQVSIIKVDLSDDVIIRSVSGNTAKLSSEATLAGPTDIVHKAYVDNNIPTSGFWNTSGSESSKTSMSSTNIFEDVNLSGIVGSNTALVYLQFRETANGNHIYAFRQKGGPGGTNPFAAPGWQQSGNDQASLSSVDFANTGDYCYLMVPTDSNGFIEIASNSTAATLEITVIGFIK